MMRRLVIIGFIMVASLAQAEILSWTVYVDGQNSNFNSAKLFATTLATANVGDTENTFLQVQVTSSGGVGVVPTDTTLLNSGSTYNYFVALYNGVTLWGYSEIKSWNELSASLWIGTPPAPMNTTYWNAVPEPTSIGLLALGMSALLLRRRRRV